MLTFSDSKSEPQCQIRQDPVQNVKKVANLFLRYAQIKTGQSYSSVY